MIRVLIVGFVIFFIGFFMGYVFGKSNRRKDDSGRVY